MLRLHRLIIGFVLLVVAGCSQGPAGEISDADNAAVRAQMEKYVAAFNAGDFEAWGNTMATDVITLPPNAAPLQGREAAVNWAKALPKMANLTSTPDEVTGLGDLAYARGTYGFTATLPDGSSVNDKGSFLEIHRRQADGTWPFTRVIWHSDLPLPAAATDPRIGTWSANIAKSKFSPGPPPKSQTLKVEPSGTGEKVTNDTVSADGTQTQTQYTANYDGRESPLTGSPLPTTVSLRRIDSHRTERIDKRDGKVIQTITRVVSQDGKTMTATVKGVNEKGQPTNNALIFEKQ